MTRNFLPILATLLIGGSLSAQTMDITGFRSVDDADVMGQSGDKIGEIEEILVDGSGNPVAAVIEVGGFLDLGSDDVVIMLSDMTFENGAFRTAMTEGQLQSLPAWDD